MRITKPPEATPRIGYSRSGGMSVEAYRVTAANASTPRVWDTVTVMPRATACLAEPRDPTRYAAMIVFPWPGETAWIAPRPRAMRSDPIRARGLRFLTWRTWLISSGTPPGPTPNAAAGRRAAAADPDDPELVLAPDDPAA